MQPVLADGGQLAAQTPIEILDDLRVALHAPVLLTVFSGGGQKHQAATPSSAVWNFTKLHALAQAVVQAWLLSVCAAWPRAVSMIERMVRAQRPHFGLQPRHA
jgi:hypothetical protein